MKNQFVSMCFITKSQFVSVNEPKVTPAIVPPNVSMKGFATTGLISTVWTASLLE